jgi:hypothetical protein
VDSSLKDMQTAVDDQYGRVETLRQGLLFIQQQIAESENEKGELVQKLRNIEDDKEVSNTMTLNYDFWSFVEFFHSIAGIS